MEPGAEICQSSSAWRLRGTGGSSSIDAMLENRKRKKERKRRTETQREKNDERRRVTERETSDRRERRRRRKGRRSGEIRRRRFASLCKALTETEILAHVPTAIFSHSLSTKKHKKDEENFSRPGVHTLGNARTKEKSHTRSRADRHTERSGSLPHSFFFLSLSVRRAAFPRVLKRDRIEREKNFHQPFRVQISHIYRGRHVCLHACLAVGARRG